MKNNNIVIGLEGLVGAGKTSICKELLSYIPNSILLHGGNLYRTIICALLSTGKSLEELTIELKDFNIQQFIDKFKIKLELVNKETVFYINNKLIKEEELQSEKSSLVVSQISQIADNSKLFEFCRSLIEDLKQKGNLIVSGRAIMDIYPNADYHFFITASLEERIKRKCIQYKESVDVDRIKENIEKRDYLQEKAGFYKIHSKTIQVDVTECRTIEESTKKVLEYIKIPVNI